MRVPSFVVYAGIIVLGALVFSIVLAFLDLAPMPGDITINQGNFHLHIAVLYSIATSVFVTLFFWWWRR